ncbi:hypothetical protein NQ318_010270 [Aromia moschata]|uniref:Uncharacterized protein n=1 Tax=Aromia moschata TaxID=1265417 RepID=A0AAV8YHJ0_9CUCU|nr:hypothetical protein NQ318_010270 [Aromia moschata]
MTIPRLVHASVCAFFGYSAFIAFVVLKNYPSAVLGLISGVTDSILFLVHYLHWKGRLGEWYESRELRILCRYGIIVGTLGLLCLGYFTTIQIMHKTPIYPIATSSAISIVWSVVAMRSGIILMFYAIRYQIHDDSNDLLGESSENNPEEGE